MTNRAALELWSLEDYRDVVWVRMYRIRLAVEQIPALQRRWNWTSDVVSQEGDVLIECTVTGMGISCAAFGFLRGHCLLGHVLKENLVSHPINVSSA
nr:F-box protein [Paspalum simplex]